MAEVIVVVRGHGQKLNRFDPGAGSGDATPVYESDWTDDATRWIVSALRALGFEADDVLVGENSTRADYADSVGASLILHVHGDTGTPAIYYWAKDDAKYSIAGHDAAQRVADALNIILPWRVTARPATVAAVPRAHGLLGLTNAPAILLELVDQRDETAVAWLRAHLGLVGLAIARSLQK